MAQGRLFLARLSVVTALLCALEAFLAQVRVPEYLVPRPSLVAIALFEDRGLLWENTLFTLKEWIVGLMASLILGIGLATVSFHVPRLRAVLHPFLVVSQAVPYMVFAPLLLIWLGLGMAPKIVLVVLTCAFPIALLLEEGFAQAREEYEVVVAMLQFSRLKAFREVYFRHALPSLFSGLKISCTYAFVSTVLSELIGSEAGLGVYMTRADNAYRTDRVVAAVVVVVATSLAATWAVDAARRKVVFWNTARK